MLFTLFTKIASEYNHYLIIKCYLIQHYKLHPQDWPQLNQTISITVLTIIIDFIMGLVYWVASECAKFLYFVGKSFNYKGNAKMHDAEWVNDIKSQLFCWKLAYYCLSCVVTDLVCKSLFSNMSVKQISHTIFIHSDFLRRFLSFLNVDCGCKWDL